jgi:hypothetical protein
MVMYNQRECLLNTVRTQSIRKWITAINTPLKEVKETTTSHSSQFLRCMSM